MSSKKPVGIIAAMDSELAGLVSALEHPRQQALWGLTFYTGLLSGRQVVLVKCGVGKVNAARTAQILIDRFELHALLNSGIMESFRITEETYSGPSSPLASYADVIFSAAGTVLCALAAWSGLRALMGRGKKSADGQENPGERLPPRE